MVGGGMSLCALTRYIVCGLLEASSGRSKFLEEQDGAVVGVFWVY